jgi:hypothetical protein
MLGAQSSVGVFNQIYESPLDRFLLIDCWVELEFSFLVASDLLFSFLLLSDAVVYIHIEAAILRTPWTDKRLIDSTYGWL